MPAVTSHLNRTEIIRSFTLTALIIIMDMSGFAGLTAQDELDERQDKLETHTSTGIWGTAEGMVGVESTYSVGDFHSCAIMENNTIYCWGNNGEGQLGTGTTTNSNTPTQVLFNAYSGEFPDGSQVWSTSATPVEIALGQAHSCARMSDGGVVCWGTGSHGVNNGAGSNNDRENPVDAIPLPGIATSIASGKDHVCAILQDNGQNIDNGSVYCWGFANYGQMGNGLTSPQNSPVGAVSLPSGAEAKQIVAGEYHTCAILTNDSMYCWGQNTYGQLGDGTRCETGIWTNNCNGVGGKNTPTKVDLPVNQIPIQIAASSDLTCAVMKSYRLYCWGYGNHVISGSATKYSTPEEMVLSAPSGWEQGPSGIVKQVALTNYNRGICVMTTLEEVSCWGYNNNYVMGVQPSGWIYSYYSAVNQTQTTGKTVSSITLGAESGCRSMNDSTLECYGYNNDGRVGIGNNTQYIPFPTTISGNHHLKMSNLDDDGDGVEDMFDNCPNGVSGWTSTSSNDVDKDGCRDSDEDDDDDGDGVNDVSDAFPLNPNSWRYWNDSDIGIPGVRYENVTINRGNFIELETRRVATIGESAYLSDPDSNPALRSLDITTEGYPTNSVFNISGDLVIAFARGSEHSCALYESGNIRCQGYNVRGQLGTGTTAFAGVDENPNAQLADISKVDGEIKQVVVTGGGLWDYYYGQTCILTTNSKVYCVGAGTATGTGSQNERCVDQTDCINGNVVRFSPTVQFPSSASRVIALYSMPYSNNYNARVCSVHEDGEAYCWGAGFDSGAYGVSSAGQEEGFLLGDGIDYGTYPPSNGLPVQVYNPTNHSITQLSLTLDTTCALMDNGSVYCLGFNYYGSVGDGTTCENGTYANNCNGNDWKPVFYDPVILPTGRNAIGIVPKSQFSQCAILDTGEVYCWGQNHPISYPHDATYLSYNGIGHLVSLQNYLVAPGDRDWDTDGILNIDDNCAISAITGWMSSSSNDSDSDGCDDSTEDLDDDNDGYTDTIEINCGTNPLDATSLPIDIDGDGQCAAFDDDDDGDGVLDVDDDFPEDPTGFVTMSIGDGFQSGQPLDNASIGGSEKTSCVILSDFSVQCWGAGYQGQQGDGTSASSNSLPSNITMPSGHTPRSLSSGSESQHICMITTDGALFCWGNNEFGQLGDGTTCSVATYAYGCNGQFGKSTPSQVNLPTSRTATAVTTGAFSTCAILDDGSVWCWGANDQGQLGVGNITQTFQSWQNIPVKTLIPASRTAISISSGDSHTCAVLDNKSVVCWGDNVNGQLASDSTFSYRNSPTYIDSAIQFNSVSAGSLYTCGISTQDRAWCWGHNNQQQLGVESIAWGDFYTPYETSLPSSRAVVSLSTGTQHACAILDDSSLYCWGDDNENQLNTEYNCDNYDTTNGCYDNHRRTPAQPLLPESLTAVALGTWEYRTCVLLSNGALICWGYAGYGVHGNGTTGLGLGPSYVSLPIGISLKTNDRDLDYDGIFNNEDDCMEGESGWVSNSTSDFDGDGCRDATEDLDDDNDFLNDTDEATIGTNSTNPDTDGDGYLDGLDAFPLDASEWSDVDSDGIGDNADTDDDNDLWSDTDEVACNTDPLNGTDTPIDTDGDSQCNYLDSDDDGDGVSDDMDSFPLDAAATTDTDGDGMPDSMSVPDLTSIPTNGLIGYWDFDDTSGNPADSSNEAHTSSTHGDPSYGVDGHAGTAIQFDGAGDYIEIDADDAFNVTNITISAWLKLGYLFLGDGPYNMYSSGLVCRGTASGPSGAAINEQVWCIDLYPGASDNGTYLRFYFHETGQPWTFTEVLTTTSLDLSWNHVVATFDGTTAKIYLNGQLEASSTSVNSGLLSSNEPVYVGTRSGGGGVLSFLDASIDEVRIYNRALSQSEITILHQVSYTLIEDLDDDNDQWSDSDETACGTNPLSNVSVPQDSDGDLVCDPLDVFPNDPTEWDDSDSDSVGDNSDIFPNDPNETSDNDGDGLGDNADTDDDNDNWSDSDEVACLTDPLDWSSIPGDIDGDGICDALELDLDNDGWTNANESYCGTDWTDINSVPVDTDGDMICDIMDLDDDGDLVLDTDDAFPLDGTEWLDSDQDGIGNNADPDDDNDGCMDLTDDLPLDPTECDDTDGDGIGNNADGDDDGDNLSDSEDPFPLDASATVDTDGDGYPDFLNGTSTTGLIADWDDDNDGWNDTDDAFPLDATEWLDTDMDGQGNNADLNDDGDPCLDVDDAFPLDASECYDTDSDGVGNNADPDDDNDGWLDTTESICGTSDPLNASSVPDDNDADGVCDLLDYDDDNDSYIDTGDAFPFDPCAAVDTDQDGEPDWIYLNCNTTLTEDLDDDNDGYLDANDTFPQDPTEWSDFDGDGLGDNYDSDDDGDQVPDEYDLFPMNGTEWADADGDGIGDNADLDDDNDGVLDDNDAFPLDAAASVDTDGDGMPDTLVGNVTTSLVEDDDDDGDGVLDIYDWAPLDPSEWVDTDGDGVGDNADADDDGDGWSDSDEYICGSNHLDASSVPPDGDGDGICDSEDDSDTSTLSGRVQYYMNSPVTVWMAVVGVLCALVIGATGSSLRSAKERRMLVQQTIDYSDSVTGHEEFGTIAVGQVEMPIPKMTPSQVGRQELVQKYLNQGYSSEVANILADDELNN
ncbi:MAG: hypothetical protein CMB18_02535 [Euryarchaeota archaeon]|nr:hypothetical protein [Euryarchaeota archaeon]